MPRSTPRVLEVGPAPVAAAAAAAPPPPPAPPAGGGGGAAAAPGLLAADLMAADAYHAANPDPREENMQMLYKVLDDRVPFERKEPSQHFYAEFGRLAVDPYTLLTDEEIRLVIETLRNDREAAFQKRLAEDRARPPSPILGGAAAPAAAPPAPIPFGGSPAAAAAAALAARVPTPPIDLIEGDAEDVPMGVAAPLLVPNREEMHTRRVNIEWQRLIELLGADATEFQRTRAYLQALENIIDRE